MNILVNHSLHLRKLIKKIKISQMIWLKKNYKIKLTIIKIFVKSKINYKIIILKKISFKKIFQRIKNKIINDSE